MTCVIHVFSPLESLLSSSSFVIWLRTCGLLYSPADSEATPLLRCTPSSSNPWKVAWKDRTRWKSWDALQHKDCVPKSGSFSEFLEADPFQYIDEGNRSNGEETKPRWKMGSWCCEIVWHLAVSNLKNTFLIIEGHATAYRCMDAKRVVTATNLQGFTSGWSLHQICCFSGSMHPWCSLQ